MTTFSIGESLKFGWETFKKRPGVLVGGFSLAMFISGVSSALLSPSESSAGILSLFMVAASVIIGTLVEMGLLTFALKAHDSVEDVTTKDLWNPKPFWRYLAQQIITGAIVIAGFILLIVPGIIAMLGLFFSSYLVIDKGYGPIQAIKESWRITKGKRIQLLLFMLVIAGFNLLGLICLVVGLLVTIPVTMLAIAHAYRKIEHKGAEVMTA